MLALVCLAVSCLLAGVVTAQPQYSVRVTRLNNGAPVFDEKKAQSVFAYNYNAAAFPITNDPNGFNTALLVRCQNNNSAVTHDPYTVTPSVLAYAKLLGVSQGGFFSFDTIQTSSVVFQPAGPSENYGTEDPRVVYRAKTGDYHLLYTAVAQFPNGSLLVQLSQAISKTPQLAASWKRLGPLFPEIRWTKSGAMLIRDDTTGPHYLFYGDSSLVPGLQFATSTNLRQWTTQPGIWLPVRGESFDSTLVEAGPGPFRLSNGHYLFIYNSARAGYPSKKPGYQLQYNVGFAILDGQDPSKILYRSSQPILSPVTNWEVGVDDLTPNVVFIEGAVPMPNSTDSFLVFYGAADQVVGIARFDVILP